MKLPLQSTIALLLIELLASCSCSRTIDERDEPDLLEHRVEGCERFCTVRSSECGPSSEDGTRLTVDECVVECASPEGAFSWHWGYREDSREDECIAEWRTHVDCLLASTCEEQHEYWLPAPGDPPLEERVCWEELRARNICAIPGED